MVHELKTLPKFFKEVVEGRKPFEVRKDDRDYQVGDLLKLNEFDPEKQKYTGCYAWQQIVYILGRNEDEKIFVPDGYVILSLKEGTPADASKFPRSEIKDMLYYRGKINKLLDNAKKNGIQLAIRNVPGDGIGIYFEDVISKESCKIRNEAIKL